MFHSSDPIQWGFRARPEVVYIEPQIIKSMDWFKGKSTGNHRFSHEIRGFPVNFPLNQSIGQIKNHQKSHWWIVLTPFFSRKAPQFFANQELGVTAPVGFFDPIGLAPKDKAGEFSVNDLKKLGWFRCSKSFQRFQFKELVTWVYLGDLHRFANSRYSPSIPSYIN